MKTKSNEGSPIKAENTHQGMQEWVGKQYTRLAQQEEGLRHYEEIAREGFVRRPGHWAPLNQGGDLKVSAYAALVVSSEEEEEIRAMLKKLQEAQWTDKQIQEWLWACDAAQAWGYWIDEDAQRWKKFTYRELEHAPPGCVHEIFIRSIGAKRKEGGLGENPEKPVLKNSKERSVESWSPLTDYYSRVDHQDEWSEKVLSPIRDQPEGLQKTLDKILECSIEDQWWAFWHVYHRRSQYEKQGTLHPWGMKPPQSKAVMDWIWLEKGFDSREEQYWGEWMKDMGPLWSSWGWDLHTTSTLGWSVDLSVQGQKRRACSVGEWSVDWLWNTRKDNRHGLREGGFEGRAWRALMNLWLPQGWKSVEEVKVLRHKRKGAMAIQESLKEVEVWEHCWREWTTGKSPQEIKTLAVQWIGCVVSCLETREQWNACQGLVERLGMAESQGWMFEELWPVIWDGQSRKASSSNLWTTSGLSGSMVSKKCDQWAWLELKEKWIASNQGIHGDSGSREKESKGGGVMQLKQEGSTMGWGLPYEETKRAVAEWEGYWYQCACMMWMFLSEKEKKRVVPWVESCLKEHPLSNVKESHIATLKRQEGADEKIKEWNQSLLAQLESQWLARYGEQAFQSRYGQQEGEARGEKKEVKRL